MMNIRISTISGVAAPSAAPPEAYSAPAQHLIYPYAAPDKPPTSLARPVRACMALAVPLRLGSYIALKRLGHGAAGVVYECKPASNPNGESVAIKAGVTRLCSKKMAGRHAPTQPAAHSAWLLPLLACSVCGEMALQPSSLRQRC